MIHTFRIRKNEIRILRPPNFGFSAAIHLRASTQATLKRKFGRLFAYSYFLGMFCNSYSQCLYRHFSEVQIYVFVLQFIALFLQFSFQRNNAVLSYTYIHIWLSYIHRLRLSHSYPAHTSLWQHFLHFFHYCWRFVIDIISLSSSFSVWRRYPVYIAESLYTSLITNICIDTGMYTVTLLRKDFHCLHQWSGAYKQ